MSTVHICLNDILGVAVACEVIFYPGDTPFSNGAALAVSGTRSIWLDAEGNGSVTLLPGRYTVRFSGITGNTDTLLIQVPTDEDAYPLPALICAGNWVLPMRDFLQKSKNLSDVADPAAAFDAIKQEATPTKAGAISLASQDEVDAGTEATKAVTPATLAHLAKWTTAGQKVKFSTVADANERLALTQTQVSTGDLVEQKDTRAVYQVLDGTILNQEAGYVLIGTRPEASGLYVGLLAFWNLEESSGIRVDATGNGHDLSESNTIGSEAGKIGNAATFDGLSYLSCEGSVLPIGDFSISAWVKTGTGDDQAIAANRERGMMFLAQDGNIKAQIFDGSGSAYCNCTAAFPNTGATFDHIVFVHDSLAKTLSLHVNGVLANSLTYEGSQQGDGTSADMFYLGARPDGYDFVGSIDEFGIWGRVLSGSEVQMLHNNGNGLSYPA